MILEREYKSILGGFSWKRNENFVVCGTEFRIHVSGVEKNIFPQLFRRIFQINWKQLKGDIFNYTHFAKNPPKKTRKMLIRRGYLSDFSSLAFENLNCDPFKYYLCRLTLRNCCLQSWQENTESFKKYGYSRSFLTFVSTTK